MQVIANIPIDIISILQAVILAFIAAPAIIRTIYRLRAPSKAEGAVTLSSWGGNK
jgi:simple sugar transport system permease protein